MRLVLGLLSFLVGLAAIIFDWEIFDFGIDNNLSWKLSKLLPWIIVLVMSILVVISFRKQFSSKVKRIIFSVSFPLFMLGLMFSLNPIYAADYISKGEGLSIDDHVLIDLTNEFKADFNGLVAIVDYHCPFCKLATKERLNKIGRRNNNIDLVITLNTGDESLIQKYKGETKSSELDYLIHPPKQELLQLTGGVFPTFVYIKDGEIKEKWKNSQLGYPALDRIESGLN